MTLQELYTNIDGNYDHAVQIMKTDRLIDKYIRKFSNNAFADKLTEADGDRAKLFEVAHAMKGVCGNLGLDTLAKEAGVITEECRSGGRHVMVDYQLKRAVDELVKRIRETEAGIKEYEEGCG